VSAFNAGGVSAGDPATAATPTACVPGGWADADVGISGVERRGVVTIGMSATARAGLAVTAHDVYGLCTSTFTNVSVASAQLPAGWSAGDIGSPGLAGSAASNLGGRGWSVSGGALVGLAVTSHNDSVLSASRLDNVSVAAPGPAPGADLSGASNRIGTVTGGTPLVGGWDGNGSAYPSSLPGASVTAGGWAFGLGAPGSDNAVQAAGQAGALPAGTDSTLASLGTAVNGRQANQTFTVAYDDGTGDTFAQSLSDWASPSTGKRLGNSTALSGSARANSGSA
jgi:hypothetical protein